MNFYNENEEEKKDGAPVLPRAASPFKKTSAFGKAPMFSRTAGGIMDRLKNLSRRDMALVSLGLSVLVMVPTAEYMMSQPSKDNLLTGGFGSKGEGLNTGSGPYEPGVNGLSQGSTDGSGEVITPLSSRDPVSLILGAQPAQPAAAPPAAYTPPSNFRDSMKDAGRAAFSEASKSAGAPTVVPRMSAALRGMSSFFGGGESSRTSGGLSGGKIIDEARSASSKAAKRSMVGPVAMAGYKGVATTPNSSSKGAMEKLRAAADKSAGNFNGDSAIRSLDKAAADAIDIGKGGGGMGAGGESDKTGKTGNSTVKGYDHNNSGESLSEMAAKQRMQKALDWEFFKKYEIPKQIINAVVGAVSTTLGKFISSNMETALGMDPPAAPKCWNPAVCPDGGSCGSQAVTYLGPDWWKATNGHAAGKLSDLCTVGGSPVAYKTVVGKESASTSAEVCICGKGSAPATGGAPAADSSGGGAANTNPGGTGNSTPPQHSAAAVNTVKDYDGILREIVKMVAETEAHPKKAEDNLKGVVGGFQNLAPEATKAIAKLGSLRDNAETELNGFNTKLSEAQGKMAEVQPKYSAFVDQIKKLQEDLAANKVAMKTEKSIEAQMPQSTKDRIQEILKQWSETGAIFYGSATGNLDAQRKWANAFTSQLPQIRNGITKISENQNAIETSWQQISSEAEATPIGKLKKLSGRLQDVEDSTAAAKSTGAAAEPPLKLTAAGQRALDWEKLWEGKKHEMDATKISEAEATEFTAWKNAIGDSKGSPQPPTMPANLINNQMRSTQLQSTIKGQLPNFDSINKDLASTTAAIDAVKNALLGYGVNPSYFGGSVPTTPPTPVSPVPPTPVSPVPPTPVSPVPPTPVSPVPPTPVSPVTPQHVSHLTPADAGAISSGISGANANLDAYAATSNSIQKLPKAVKPTSAYGVARQNAVTKLNALNTAKANVEKAKADLVNLPDTATKAEATAAIRRMDKANEEFRSANTAAKSAYTAANAIVPHTPSNTHPTSPIVPPSTAALDARCESMRANFRSSLASENTNVSLAIDAANKAITASKAANKAYADCLKSPVAFCGAKDRAANAAMVAMSDRMASLRTARSQCNTSLSTMRGQLTAAKCTGNNDIGYCK